MPPSGLFARRSEKQRSKERPAGAFQGRLQKACRLVWTKQISHL
jgi:hypothetical protein